MGFEHEFEIERVWLLAIIDVCTRAVLGYHLALGREYSRYDVIKTIESALEPHRPRDFTIPGLVYGSHDGFPSQRMPELAYTTWEWMKLDNAKANLAKETLDALCEFVGCCADAGPKYSPDDRPYIERFFGTIASRSVEILFDFSVEYIQSYRSPDPVTTETQITEPLPVVHCQHKCHVGSGPKYAQENGTITVEAARRPDGAVAIAVSDDGPGIPDKEKPIVLERFYRGDASRSTPGVGLGLSLVAAVAKQHGDVLELTDNHPGLRATLILFS